MQCHNHDSHLPMLLSGRMRSTGGKIVAIVDSKLQEQHRKNKVHEATMDRALQEVRGSAMLYNFG